MGRLRRRGPLAEQAVYALGERLGQVWRRRADRYSEARTAQTPASPKVEMSFIGG